MEEAWKSLDRGRHNVQTTNGGLCERGQRECSANHVLLSHVAVLWMTVCFSLYAVIARNTEVDLSPDGRPPLTSPFGFILTRQSAGALVLAILARTREGPFPERLADPAVLRQLVVCGVVGIGLSQNFFILGERYTTATTAVIYEPLVPMVTAIAGYFFGTELSWGSRRSERCLKCVGSAIGVCGAVIAARGSLRAKEAPESGAKMGNLFCVGQVLCIAGPSPSPLF